jgi:hypothetical protein
MDDFSGLSNETLLRAYEDIRNHISADSREGGKYRFMGEVAKARATGLLAEIQRRGLAVSPISWPN